MLSRTRRLICATTVVMAVIAPGAAADGVSAGDQQYVDPLAAATSPGSAAKGGSGSSGPTTSAGTPSSTTSAGPPSSPSSAVATGAPAASGPSSAGSAAEGSAPTGASATSAALVARDPGGSGTLPYTGTDVSLAVLSGVMLLGGGLVLRRLAAAR